MDTSATILHPSFIDPTERDRVVVRGPDALSYLHSQIAQDVRALPVGDAAWTLVLEPTGKVNTLARVTRTDEDEFTFDIDAGFGEVLADRLRRFKIRVDAEVEVHDAAVPEPAPTNEDARIEAGWPRMGHEIVPGETIPAVTGVVGVAVNFTKGCYPGQELVERMDSRGAEAPSSLRILAIGTDVPLGTVVDHPVIDTSGTTIGTITSVGTTHALATIKRGHDLGTVPAHLQ
jgi:tRNA-modifying protein YgfZ